MKPVGEVINQLMASLLGPEPVVCMLCDKLTAEPCEAMGIFDEPVCAACVDRMLEQAVDGDGDV